MLRTLAAALFLVSGSAFAEDTSARNTFDESVPSNDGTETPNFAVLASGPDGIEVRRYEPVIEAFTTVEASDARAAANEAFMTVAGYIFGANEGGDGGPTKIDMTAPVRTTSGAPHRHDGPGADDGRSESKGGNTLDEDGSYTIAFVMPSKWTMESLPKPKDPAVALRKVPTEVRAALPFKGERGPRGGRGRGEAPARMAGGARLDGDRRGDAERLRRPERFVGRAALRGVHPRDEVGNVELRGRGNRRPLRRAHGSGRGRDDVLPAGRNDDHHRPHRRAGRRCATKASARRWWSARSPTCALAGRKIMPLCPFAAAQFRKHPEWTDLRA